MGAQRMTGLPAEITERIQREAAENDVIYRRRSAASLDLSAIHYGHAKMLEWAFQQLPSLKGARILDIGVGDGYSSVQLALAGAQVTSIEVSAAALERVGTLAKRYNVNIELQQMAGEDLRFEDASFDAILCISAYHHMDLERAAREFARVLRPGGRAVMVEPLISNPPAWLYRKIGWLFSREATTEERALRIGDLTILERHFRKAGWQGIFLFSIALFGIDRLWENRNCTVQRLTKAAFEWVYPLDCRLLQALPMLQRIAWKIGIRADR
jgi:SAM-dependent methyltransferase